MSVDEHRKEASRASFGCALLTVSDSRTEKTDEGGDLLQNLVERAGHRVNSRELVPDEKARIGAAVEAALVRPGIDVVLVTGGTGFSPRDVTVEAVTSMFDREIPGFGELFRMLSFAEIGAAAMLSRATAGIARARAIFLLPGSPAALELALSRLILPELAHLLAQARRSAAPGRAES
jgi:molybdenum cofactor biosynthesis protein B